MSYQRIGGYPLTQELQSKELWLHHDGQHIRLGLGTKTDRVEAILTPEDASHLAVQILSTARDVERKTGKDVARSPADILRSGTTFQPTDFEHLVGLGKGGRLELSFSVLSTLTMCFALTAEQASDIADKINEYIHGTNWRAYKPEKGTKQ
jgi:hypothetical protein